MKIQNNISNNDERKSLELIQTIGDITVKSIQNYENVTIIKGIEKLTHIAKTFLDLKHKNNKKYEVNQESGFSQTKLKNQYITYIVNEFERIFNTCVDKHNTNANKLLIFKLTEILDKTMQDESNWNVFQQLIDTRNFFGSLYWKMFQYAIRNDAHNEKILLSQSLVTIPQLTILKNKYHLQYVDHFLLYHLFRVLKLIIENKDYELFKNIIDNYTTAITINNPEKIRTDIEFDLWFHNIVFQDEVLDKKREDIMFLLKYEIPKNYNLFPELFQMLDEYRTLILEKISNEQSYSNQINAIFNKILPKIIELYVSSRLYATFFRIGAFLIFKGNDYPKFIHELWYHVDREHNTTIHTNATPVLDDPVWQTLFSIYEGHGNTMDVGISEFDNFQDSKFYLFKYSVMLMLKTKRVIPLLNTQELQQLKEQDQIKKLDFYYELARNIPITEFKKAIEEIEQTPEIYSIINLQNTEETLEDRIKFVKEKINELEVSRDNILQFIETDGNVDTSKVIEVQENIKKKYLELSITNNIAKVSYDDNIPESNCIRVSIQQLLPRTYFVEEKSISKFLNEPSRSDNADQEEKEVFNFIISKIQSTADNDVDYLKQIQEQVKKLKDKGFNPNVIFMPLSVKFKLQRDNWGLFKNNVLEINDSKLLIIRSWKKFNFKNMVIFDSNGLGITYKAPDKENRIVVDYSGTESGTRYVVYTSKNSFILEILNSEAFVNIENNEIKLLDN